MRRIVEGLARIMAGIPILFKLWSALIAKDLDEEQDRRRRHASAA